MNRRSPLQAGPIAVGCAVTLAVHGALVAGAVVSSPERAGDWAVRHVLLSRDNPAVEVMRGVLEELAREEREEETDPRAACMRTLAGDADQLGGWAVYHVVVPALLAEGSPESLLAVDGICRRARRAHLHRTLAAQSVRFGLCGTRRCAAPERPRKRRAPEPPPLEELEILEAQLLPALGMVEPDKGKLPVLQTYEQPEIVEDGVNLDRDNQPPEDDKKKEFDPRDAKRDRKNPKDLDALLKDFKDDDPRRRATRLEAMVGSPDGEIGGQGDVAKAGNLYGAKVRRTLRRDFRVPPFIEPDTLARLKLSVRVTRMGLDGSILSYRVLSRSGNPSFDAAALQVIKLYSASDGGSKRLPVPDPEVLRWINTKGMRIVLDGRHMAR